MRSLYVATRFFILKFRFYTVEFRTVAMFSFLYSFCVFLSYAPIIAVCVSPAGGSP